MAGSCRQVAKEHRAAAVWGLCVTGNRNLYMCVLPNNKVHKLEKSGIS
jgi:hypothetical protein